MSASIMVWAKDGAVSVGAYDGVIYALTPVVAIQLAQSLVRKAKEADPFVDVDAAIKAYTDQLPKEVH